MAFVGLALKFSNIFVSVPFTFLKLTELGFCELHLWIITVLQWKLKQCKDVFTYSFKY